MFGLLREINRSYTEDSFHAAKPDVKRFLQLVILTIYLDAAKCCAHSFHASGDQNIF